MTEEIEKKQLTVYYAHPKTHYNTELEFDCYEFLTMVFMGVEFEVFNPNEPILSKLYMNRKEENHSDRFEIFRELARASDILVMTTFLDGTIGAGVGEEGAQAMKAGKIVFLLTFTELEGKHIPCIQRISEFPIGRLLSYEDTLEKLENGAL